MKTSGITFVSPGLYLCGKDTDWESSGPRPGFVPILKSDIPKFEKSLKHLNKNRGKVNDNVELDSSEVKDGSVDNVVTEANRFVDIKSFLPISLEQQLHTVCLKNVPIELDKKSVNKILETIEDIASRNIIGTPSSLISQWSMLDSVESLSLFIKFKPIHEYGDIIRYIIKLFGTDQHSLRIYMDENTKRFVEAQRFNDKDIIPSPHEIQKIDSLISLLKNGTKDKESRKGNPVVEYKVDISTLSDLPNSLLDQLCEDIVEFRTRVLTLEKEKREKEALEEEKQRKHHLKQIFEKIKNSNTHKKDKNVAVEDTGEDDDDDDDDDDNDNDNDNDDDDEQLNTWGNDKQYEHERLQNERSQQETHFNDLLKTFEHVTLPKLNSLKHDLNQLKNRQFHLDKNKGVYLKELLHLASDPHFDHHRQFKDTEAENDRIDREQEERESQHSHKLADRKQPSLTDQTSPEVESEEPKIKLALKQILKRKPEDELPISSPTPDTKISSLPIEPINLPQRIQKLRKSGIVDELVKEYLGIYEPDLVDYILQNIEENQSKDALEKELAETFDEDSPVLVKKIWDAL